MTMPITTQSGNDDKFPYEYDERADATRIQFKHFDVLIGIYNGAEKGRGWEPTFDIVKKGEIYSDMQTVHNVGEPLDRDDLEYFEQEAGVELPSAKLLLKEINPVISEVIIKCLPTTCAKESYYGI
ncbi:hypothetical protein AB6D11_18590 [Vibrio splendidus]